MLYLTEKGDDFTLAETDTLEQMVEAYHALDSASPHPFPADLYESVAEDGLYDPTHWVHLHFDFRVLTIAVVPVVDTRAFWRAVDERRAEDRQWPDLLADCGQQPIGAAIRTARFTAIRVRYEDTPTWLVFVDGVYVARVWQRDRGYAASGDCGFVIGKRTLTEAAHAVMEVGS